ncbi:MAG: SurA N-terminal domain-containing protein [Roseivirga sp.]
MAIIGTIRKHSGLTVGIVISGLILFLVGGDLFQLSLSGRRSTHVGKIAGEKISLQTYQNQLEAMRRTLPAQASHPQLQAMIRERAWEQLINRLTYQKACDTLGLTVSEDELVDMVQGNHIHPELQATFSDPTTGQFDKQQLIKHLQSLGQMPSAQQVQWHYFEKELAASRQHEKLTRLMEQSTFLTDLAAQQQYDATQTALHVQYLYIPYYTCQDEKEVTDTVLKNYLATHKNDYQVKESRKAQFVTFPVTPTAEDQKVLEEALATLKPSFAQAQDDLTFAKNNTEGDPAMSYASFAPEQLPAALAQQKTSLKKGQVIGPVQEGDVHKLYKVAALPTKSSQQYEIVIIEKQLVPSDQARDQAFRKAHHCASSVKDAAQLAIYVEKEALHLHTASAGKNDEQAGVLTNARELVRWLYNEAKVGQVSPVFELGDDYVVAVMTEHVQEGTAPLEQVRDEITLKVQNEHKAQTILAQLKLLQGTSLAEKAAAYGPAARVIEAAQVHWSDGTLKGVGMASNAIGAAFALQPGEQTTVADEHGVLLIELIKKHDTSSPEDMAAYKQSQQQTARSRQPYCTAQALRELAKVKDERYRFY